MNQPSMTIYDNGGHEIVQQEERWLHTHSCGRRWGFAAFLRPRTITQLYFLVTLTEDVNKGREAIHVG